MFRPEHLKDQGSGMFRSEHLSTFGWARLAEMFRSEHLAGFAHEINRCA
jgi:hypothetical protein